MDNTAALLDFLMERRLHGDYTWVGRSSDAMVDAAVTGAKIPSDWPHDEDDLGRCEETYRRAPAFLKRKMLRHLIFFRRVVEVGGLYCLGCDTGGHSGTRQHLCRSCWESKHGERWNAELDRLMVRTQR